MKHTHTDERAELAPYLTIPGILAFIGDTDWRSHAHSGSALLRRLQEAERAQTPPKQR